MHESEHNTKVMFSFVQTIFIEVVFLELVYIFIIRLSRYALVCCLSHEFR